MSLIKSIQSAISAPFYRKFGVLRSLSGIDYAWDNGFESTADDSSGVHSRRHSLIGVDTSNQLRVGGQVTRPVRTPVPINMPLTADVATKIVFVAPFACRVVGIRCNFATANGAALTANITKESVSGTGAAGTGVTLLASAFDLNATAATEQVGTLTTSMGRTDLVLGDRLSFYIASGSATSIAGLQITIFIEPGCGKTLAVFSGTLVDQNFFVANRYMNVEAAYCVYGTAGSSTPTVQIEKVTGTTAAGSGTNLLTNNGNTGFLGNATARVMQTGTLTATAADKELAPGDRLAVDVAGTLTAWANLVIVVVLSGVEDEVDVTFNAQGNTSNVDQTFFIADRPYRVVAARQVHGTAGTDGSAVTLQVEICRRTVAVGSGDNTLSSAFDLKGTANTIQIGAFLDRGIVVINTGDRLVADVAGTITSLVNNTCTVSLQPV
jgi:hypothetical protein